MWWLIFLGIGGTVAAIIIFAKGTARSVAPAPVTPPSVTPPMTPSQPCNASVSLTMIRHPICIGDMIEFSWACTGLRAFLAVSTIELNPDDEVTIFSDFPVPLIHNNFRMELMKNTRFNIRAECDSSGNHTETLNGELSDCATHRSETPQTASLFGIPHSATIDEFIYIGWDVQGHRAHLLITDLETRSPLFDRDVPRRVENLPWQPRQVITPAPTGSTIRFVLQAIQADNTEGNSSSHDLLVMP